MSVDRMKVVVVRADVLPGDTLMLEMVAGEGGNLPPFGAGDHVEIYIKDGLSRHYSLCGDPAHQGTYRLAIQKEVQSRGGSLWLHENITVGAVLEISAPRNNFHLPDHIGRAVLVGGGIGITPLLSIAHDQRAWPSRPT